MPLFTQLSSQHICDQIESASKYIILAAPGVSVEVAKVLLSARQRLGDSAIQVVVDVSAQVARLGYGSHAAVELLQQQGVVVRHQAGMRIGIFICDDFGWSFASFPALVEADPCVESEAYNAVALTEAQVMMLRAELPPVKNHQTEVSAFEYPVVGSEPVEEEHLNNVTNALKIAPPQPFDLARQTQVYAALIQFVELKFEGFSIQNRRIQLPKTLPLITSKDKELKQRVNASLKILDKFDKPKVLSEVSDRLDELRLAYLVPAGRAGRVILKSKLGDFESELSAIEDTLNKCKAALCIELQEALDQVVNAIAPDLTRAALKLPPPQFRGLFPITEEFAGIYVRGELSKVFPTAESLVKEMKIHKFYKDVTYETLKNKEFKEKIMQGIPRSVLDGALLQEDVAAQSAIKK